jgi:hypothetical protein
MSRMMRSAYHEVPLRNTTTKTSTANVISATIIAVRCSFLNAINYTFANSLFK